MSKSSVGLSEPAYQYILQQIMTKQLMPGDKIPETKIAQEFNISRTPVRDALRQLSNEGLIEIFPNRFARVRIFTPEEIVEIGTLRLAIDIMAVKLANLYGSRADFLHLIELAEACTAAYEAGDTQKKFNYDTEYHNALAEISGNRLMLKTQRELYLCVQYILLHHPELIEDELKHLQQHFEIAEALMAHDEEKAIALVSSHLSSFYGLNQRYPEGFFKFSY